MRHLPFHLLVAAALAALPAAGQEPKPAGAEQAEAPKPEEKKEEPPAPAALISGEAPNTWLLEAGIRWISGPAGDFNTYRSIVNLGEGWRLTRAEYNFEQPGGRLVDELHFRASDWGGDPYNTAFLDLGKRRTYLYRGRYSNIAYFNYLPSFANPGLGLLGQGIYLNQRSFDTQVRNFDNEFEIAPGSIFSPYIHHSRNSDFGNGITNLVADGNEYPLRTNLTWSQQNVRGGLRLTMRRFHGTIEQGWLRFKDDQGVFSTERLNGNRGTVPYLGQTLFLSSGQQFYRTRGEGDFTTAQITGNPWNWLDVAGFYVRSKPKTSTTFTQEQSGNLFQSGTLFFPRGTDQFFGSARMPRTSWSGSAEVRPWSRLRIREIFESDRFRNDSSGVLSSLIVLPNLAPPTNTLTTTEAADQRLEVSQNRQQIEALFDLARGVVARGGYRFEFGKSLVPGNFLSPPGGERAEMRRHVGLAGAQVRAASRLVLNADLEVGEGERTYYRTGLYDSVRFRAQGRLTLPKDLIFQAIYLRFNNKNPTTGIDYDYAAQSVNASLQWLPRGGRGFSLLADYNRSAIRSDIQFLVPASLQPAQSLYRDNAHTGTVLADMVIPFRSTYKGRLTVGGSFVHTSGSRPSRFYQPQGRFSVPFARNVDVFVDWRWWGLTQPFYLYEGFRTHAVTTGLRFSR